MSTTPTPAIDLSDLGAKPTTPPAVTAQHPTQQSAIDLSDLGAKLVVPPDQALSRTNANMAAAMSGQPQSTPEDQANFDQGKKAGTIQGGVDIAAGAVAGPIAGRAAEMLRPTMVAKTIGTGLLDAGGKEIMREVFEHGPSELAQSLQKLLPAKATVEQLEKIGRILYHVGAPTAAATYLFHELFGGK